MERMKACLKQLLIVAALIPSCAMPAIAQNSVTLGLWHNHPEWKARVEAILQKFESSHPNIHIELEEINGPEYTARLNTAIAAGEAPDLISVKSRSRNERGRSVRLPRRP
jgi:multiple sugar transport system substrate-binding protein